MSGPSFTQYGELKVSSTLSENSKVQDDDDGLWRFLRSRTIMGVPTLYLAEPGDNIPGVVVRVQDDDDGLWRIVRSKHVMGTPTLYLREIP